MICPHCKNSIQEEQRYLMSRDPDGEYVWTPRQIKVAFLVLGFLIAVGLFQIIASHL